MTKWDLIKEQHYLSRSHDKKPKRLFGLAKACWIFISYQFNAKTFHKLKEIGIGNCVENFVGRVGKNLLLDHEAMLFRALLGFYSFCDQKKILSITTPRTHLFTPQLTHYSKFLSSLCSIPLATLEDWNQYSKVREKCTLKE